MNDRKYTRLLPPDFPLLLKESKFMPPQLYVAGRLPPIDAIGIAMVGTRRPSNSARELCRRLVNSLRGTKAVVVSGLAQGIDSLCHEAALEAGIPTIAVLAQGLDTHIEGSRGELAARILKAGGAVVSEFEPDEPAYKSHFPARNRIIAGLSQATIVVQSKEKGGALLTADFCRKEGRMLVAVPGDFDNEVAQGPNILLDGGLAKPVFIPENLHQILGLTKDSAPRFKNMLQIGIGLSEAAEKMLRKNNGFKKTFSELESETKLSPQVILAILTELELAGFVETQDNFQFYFNGAI
ncbi:MAG: DNA-protecting protein DprA [Fibrobacter sp.]|nr:DNA-protecting protein DprA [Fibrobacter sp.]